MGYALQLTGSKSGNFKLLKYILFLAALLLPFFLALPEAGGWSSWSYLDRNKTPFGTHERFNYMAYSRLGRHPLLDPEAVNSKGQRIVHFPSLDEIQNFSYISGLGWGPGPDNGANSVYSEHYYNPVIHAGGAPSAVKSHFDYLKGGFKNPYLLKNKIKIPHQAAKHAAYGAHYIQDMTCQFHVLGLPRYELPEWEKQQPGREIIGPFGKFISDRWKKLYRFALKDSKKPDVDWLELNYYDGFGFREFAFPILPKFHTFPSRCHSFQHPFLL